MWCFLASGGCFGFEEAMRGRDTPPSPLERGDLNTAFLLVISGLLCLFPLLRGDKGVCYGEGRGLG